MAVPSILLAHSPVPLITGLGGVSRAGQQDTFNLEALIQGIYGELSAISDLERPAPKPLHTSEGE